MVSVPQRYGIGFSILIISYSAFILYLFGDIRQLSPQKLQLLESLGYFRYIILLVGLYLTMRAFRAKATGQVTFRSLFSAGVVYTCFVSSGVGFLEMFYLYLNPEFYDTFNAAYLDQLRLKGADEAMIIKAKETMTQYSFMKEPWANGLYYFFETAMIGLIVSLVFSMIMRPRIPS